MCSSSSSSSISTAATALPILLLLLLLLLLVVVVVVVVVVALYCVDLAAVKDMQHLTILCNSDHGFVTCAGIFFLYRHFKHELHSCIIPCNLQMNLMISDNTPCAQT